MAVEPLFVFGPGVDPDPPGPSMEVFYRRVRLKSLKITDSTKDIVDRFVQEVRVNLYASLGIPLIDLILETDPSDNPTTAEGLRRLTAENAEVAWFNYLFFTEMPVGVFDSFVSEPATEVWNKEPLTRDIDPDLWEEHRNALWEKLQGYLNTLLGEPSRNVRALDIGPSATRYKFPPGSSVVPGGTQLPYQGYDPEDN